jgi:MerR-like DNA binding protein
MISDTNITSNMTKNFTQELLLDIISIIKRLIKHVEPLNNYFIYPLLYICKFKMIGSDLMRSISEVAKLIEVHTQTLRNWEKKGLITPTRIGNVRVYSSFDIQRLQEIKKYSGKGIQSRGISELLRLNGNYNGNNGNGGKS